MKRLYEVKSEIYVLKSKPIERGSIAVCTNGCGLADNKGNLATRPVGPLETVLVVNPHPQAGNDFQFRKINEPVRVIGVREVNSTEPLSVYRDGFVNHPDYFAIYTSPHASGLIPVEAYLQMMENIRTADDVVGLKVMINKYYGVVC